jgi:transposase
MTTKKPAELMPEPTVEILPGPRRAASRRVFSADEKRLYVEEASQPGSSVSSVARKHGLSPSLLFRWKRLAEERSMSSGLVADGEVVPEAEVRQMKARIRELERQLARKTLENEFLKEAIEIWREKKLISRSPLPKRGSGQ